VLKLYLCYPKENKEEKLPEAVREPLDSRSKCLLIMEFNFDTVLCSNTNKILIQTVLNILERHGFPFPVLEEVKSD